MRKGWRLPRMNQMCTLNRKDSLQGSTLTNNPSLSFGPLMRFVAGVEFGSRAVVRRVLERST